MKKVFILSVAYILAAIQAQAQNDSVPLDTICSIQLNEIEIVASNIINKGDIQLAMPTQEARKRSATGSMLLGNMQLPGIVVSATNGSISLANGGTLSLRINGRPVENSEVQALSPKNIVRVEYHPNPSLRYGNVDAVLDFIVRNEDVGGNMIVNLVPSINREWWQGFASINLHTGKSEFSAGYDTEARWRFKAWRDNTETYTLPDGSSYKRIETGIPNRTKSYFHNIRLGYSYRPDSKQLLSFNSYTKVDNVPIGTLKGTLYSTLDKSTVKVEDFNSNYLTTTALDIYYQNNISNDKTISANLVGGYLHSHSLRQYNEISQPSDTLVSVGNDLRNNGYNMLFTFDFEKKTGSKTFTTGTSINNSWTDTKYIFLGNSDSMHKMEIYLYGEWRQRLTKIFTYSAGLGTSIFRHSAYGDSRTSIIARPRITIKADLNHESNIRLELSNYGTTATMEELSMQPQQIDAIQTQIGNNALKTFQTYMATLHYEYITKRIYAKVRGQYWYSNKPIMGEKYWDGQNIISTFANQRNFQKMNFDITFRAEILPSWFTASGVVGWQRSISHGNQYTHCYNHWFYSGNIQLYHWNFTLEYGLKNNYNTFWGENLYGCENVEQLMLSYNYSHMNFRFGLVNPFTKNYSVPSENWNKYAGFKRAIHTRGVDRLAIVSFTYFLNWGKPSKNSSKREMKDLDIESIKAAHK